MAARERGRVGETLKRVLSTETGDADLLNSLAWFCATADLFLEEAVEAAERAVALRPGDANILDTLAEAYFRDGRAAEAEAAIKRAIEIDPQSSYFKEQLERFEAP
jgi:cytochrome c-type biogenesis protein CcmH/NrfG